MGVIPTTKDYIEFDQSVIDRVLRLRIIDNMLFRYFANNREAVNEIIDGYLGKHVRIIDTNPKVTLTNFHKEVTLDSLSYLEGNTFVDIEVQNRKVHNDFKKCWYHASLITANKAGKKCDFDDIPNVIVIYIMDYIGNDIVKPLTLMSNGDGYDLYLVTNKIKDNSDASELTQLLSDSSLEIHNEKYPAICEFFNRLKRDKGAIWEMCRDMEKRAAEGR